MSDIPVSEQRLDELIALFKNTQQVSADLADDLDAILSHYKRLRTAQPKGESGVTIPRDAADRGAWELECAAAREAGAGHHGAARNLDEWATQIRSALRAPSPSAVATSSGEGELTQEQIAVIAARVARHDERDETVAGLMDDREALLDHILYLRHQPPAKASAAFEGVTEALLIADSLEENQHVIAHGDDATSDMIGNAYKLLRSLASRLTRGYAAGWQPIETAPRDSSRILVGYTNYEGRWIVHEAWWCMPYESAPAKSCYWRHDGDSTLLSGDVHKSSEGKKLGATHWQPLPPAPYVSAESEGA